MLVYAAPDRVLVTDTRPAGAEDAAVGVGPVELVDQGIDRVFAGIGLAVPEVDHETPSGPTPSSLLSLHPVVPRSASSVVLRTCRREKDAGFSGDAGIGHLRASLGGLAQQVSRT